jgi:hypothetical protein
MYRVDNQILEARQHLRWHDEDADDDFTDGLRNLTNPRALSVRVAYSAVRHFQEDGYAPANLTSFAGRTNGFEGIIEHVVPLPEAGVDLADLGAPAPPTPSTSG